MDNQFAQFTVPSRHQVEKWGQGGGDISMMDVVSRVRIEGRYSIAFPIPTSVDEANAYVEMAEHIATLLNAHEANVTERASLDTRGASMLGHKLIVRGHYHVNTLGHIADRLCNCSSPTRYVCGSCVETRAALALIDAQPTEVQS